MQGWALIRSHLPAMDRRLCSCIACCRLLAEVQMYERYKKKVVLVARALLDPEVEASQEVRLRCDQRKLMRYVRLTEMLI